MKKGFKLPLLLTVISLGILQTACIDTGEKKVMVQAHRGGAALYPENTIPAMVHAVKLGAKTLEMDLQVTKDSQVVVSHDFYLNNMKALYPDGTRIPENIETSLQIFTMNYDSLCRFDVGSLTNPQYPGRKDLRCAIPTLTDLIDCIETYTSGSGRHPVHYNIEIKSAVEKDGICTPDYRSFCDLSMQVLLKKKLADRLCIQSFDTRSLNYLHQKYPHVQLSYLVEEEGSSVDDFLNKLDFVPQVISPASSIVDEEFVSAAQKRGMKIVPWTVDTKDEVLRLKSLGVDEIITNYPDSVQHWLTIDYQKAQYIQAVSFFETLMGY